MTGYIKFYRKTRNSAVYSDPYLLKLWIHCLMKATHTEHEQLVGRKVIILQPGEFVTGRDVLADEYNRGAKPKNVVISRTLWRWMKLLEELQMLSIKSETKYSIVTILNWNEYQQDVQQMSNKRPTDVQQMSTNKNVKKDKNDKKKKTSSPKQVYDDTSEYFQLASLLLNKMIVNNPDMKKPNLQNWSNDIRIMMQQDNRNYEQVKYLINWSQINSFWHKNILSPSSLRRNWDKMVLQVKDDKNKTKGQASYVPTEAVEEFKLDLTKGED